jgi:hypothetical protein
MKGVFAALQPALASSRVAAESRSSRSGRRGRRKGRKGRRGNRSRT